MNKWRIKKAYKHRNFPPLNSKEKEEREIARPYIALLRATRQVEIALDQYIQNYAKAVTTATEKATEQLQENFTR